MLKITLQIGNQEFNVPSGFKLSKKLNATNLLHCVMFDPPIKHGNGFLEYVHLTDFTRTEDDLMFYPSKNEITLPKDVDRLRLSIIPPGN